MANQTMTLTQAKMFSTGIPINNCVIVSNNYIGQNNNQTTKRVLAPAPERNTVLITNSADLRCKRKIQFIPNHTGSGGTMQPASVARRNARERNRVKQVNNGFAALRQHIPANVLSAFAPQSGTGNGRGANKKLSKVETLKLAVEYIRSLKQMLEDHEAEMGTPKSEFYPSSNSPDQYSYPIILPTPPASESSASPTPSESSSTTPVFTSPTLYKQYGYDNYEPNSPEDEELLDAIFSWQQNS